MKDAKATKRRTREERETGAFLDAIRTDVLTSHLCVTCGGNGECSQCNGTGEVDCECRCGHEHEAECKTCHGSGDCEGCDGAGDSDDTDAPVGLHSADGYTLMALHKIPVGA